MVHQFKQPIVFMIYNSDAYIPIWEWEKSMNKALSSITMSSGLSNTLLASSTLAKSTKPNLQKKKNSELVTNRDILPSVPDLPFTSASSFVCYNPHSSAAIKCCSQWALCNCHRKVTNKQCWSWFTGPSLCIYRIINTHHMISHDVLREKHNCKCV